MYDVLFVLSLIKHRNRFPIKILQNRLIFTDLCSSDHLPEVEIFSLLEEQIPKYKLRADTLTQFTGYQNEVSYSKIIHRIHHKNIPSKPWASEKKLYENFVFRIGLFQAQHYKCQKVVLD